MQKILIKNGNIICPISKINSIMDIFIENGIIKNIDKNIELKDCEIIDAAGLYVSPGFVDIHVHLRDPGQEHKEDFETGSRAAAKGGFTTICAMPNTTPTIDNKKWVEYTIKKSNEIGICNILPIGAITKGLKGQELANLKEMADAGAVAFSDDGYTIKNAKILLDAFKIAKELSIPIFSHCEDIDLDIDGYMPKISENLIISRDILLAEEANACLHICHISSSKGIEILKEAKSRYNYITGEVAPHHFILDDSSIPIVNNEKDSNFKMNPPLRDNADIIAIKQALNDNIINIIATDHAPHSIEEKAKGYKNAPNGIIGLETSFALSYTHLVKPGIIELEELIKKMSYYPSSIINIDKGSLEIGKIADIAIFDLNNEYTIDSNFESKSKNSPFVGNKVFGKIKYTILNGKIVYKEEL